MVVDVQKYDYAIGQVAHPSMRSIIGKSELGAHVSRRTSKSTPGFDSRRAPSRAQP
jgi:regulator of protease activity HflC (stomatin/prohibitin superfamily)